MNIDRERAAFEWWASDEGENPQATERIGGCYKLSQIQSYWMAWQARAALQVECDALAEASSAALSEIEEIMQEAYNSAYPVCCGRPGQECCGSPAPEWSEVDQRTMDRLGHHQRALNSALATYREQGGD